MTLQQTQTVAVYFSYTIALSGRLVCNCESDARVVVTLLTVRCYPGTASIVQKLEIFFKYLTNEGVSGCVMDRHQ